MNSPNKKARLNKQKKEKPFQRISGVGIETGGEGRGEWQRESPKQ